MPVRSFRFLLALLMALATAAQTPEDAIRRVLQDQAAAWNRGEIDEFMKGYQNSARTAFVGKEVTRGFAPVLERYRQRYPSREKMGTLAFSDLDVRLLGDNHAVVIGRFHLARTAAAGGDAGGLFTLVFEKTTAGWKIIVDHTS